LVIIKDKKNHVNVSMITGRMETEIFYILNLTLKETLQSISKQDVNLKICLSGLVSLKRGIAEFY